MSFSEMISVTGKPTNNIFLDCGIIPVLSYRSYCTWQANPPHTWAVSWACHIHSKCGPHLGCSSWSKWEISTNTEGKTETHSVHSWHECVQPWMNVASNMWSKSVCWSNIEPEGYFFPFFPSYFLRSLHFVVVLYPSANTTVRHRTFVLLSWENWCNSSRIVGTNMHMYRCSKHLQLFGNRNQNCRRFISERDFCTFS